MWEGWIKANTGVDCVDRFTVGGIQERSADGDTKRALTKQEGIMMSSKQWIQRGVLCGLLLTGVVGCSMVQNPSVDQIAPTDHAALATWYDKEAAQLRRKAKDMEVMAKRYAENPHLSTNEGRVAPKFNMVEHCSNLVGVYTNAAEGAEALSRQHHSMAR